MPSRFFSQGGTHAQQSNCKRRSQTHQASSASPKGQKAQKRKLAKLKRDGRTRQLCERGGELNRLLQRPDDLTDEQVNQFLRDVFALPVVQDKLAAILPPVPLENLAEQSEPDALNLHVLQSNLWNCLIIIEDEVMESDVSWLDQLPITPARKQFPDDRRKTVFTMTVEESGDMKAEYEYDHHSEDMIDYEETWEKIGLV